MSSILLLCVNYNLRGLILKESNFWIMKKDYYETLGILRNASKDDIKKAFRKLAHKYHPDKQGGDEGRFKEISEAYNILSDEKRRAEYDSYGRVFTDGSGPAGGGFGGFDFTDFTKGFQGEGGQQGWDFDLGDIFGDVFGGAREKVKRGRDISIDVELSFQESVFGTERRVVLNKTAVCGDCAGSGAHPGTVKNKCSVCNGKGKIHETRRSFFGTFSTVRPCNNCRGIGEVPKDKCRACGGLGILKKEQEIDIKIPAGIDNGEMIRMSQAGEAVAGGVSGDLYVKIHVVPHKHFRKEGSNLVTDLNVKLSTALLGGEYVLDSLDGRLTVKIPRGVSFGEILRIKGRGVIGQRGKRGDLLIKVKIGLPSSLSKDAEKLVEKLKEEGI